MNLDTVTQTITDPAEWNGSLFGSQLELVQLTESSFASNQSVTDLSGVKLLRLVVNQPIKVRTRFLTLRYAAATFDNDQEGYFAGAPIKAGRLFVMPPKFDFDACIKDRGFACISVFAPPEEFEPFYETLTGTPVPPLETMITVSPKSEEYRSLVAWPILLKCDSQNSWSLSQRSKIQQSLRDSVLTLLAHAIQAGPDHTTSQEGKPVDRTKLARARKLVRIAEDYANSSPELTLRMIDLCRVTEVSERTLQYAFQICLGISPMSFLKRKRLLQVRRELKQADSSKDKVSSIACQFGFFHFGEFAKAYKSQFNESPSQTLKRPN